jgi:hypothetical protein
MSSKAPSGDPTRQGSPPSPPPGLKTYSVQLVNSESPLRFEAEEAVVDPGDGLLKFYGANQNLLYLIPVPSVSYIKVSAPTPPPQKIDFLQ